MLVRQARLPGNLRRRSVPRARLRRTRRARRRSGLPARAAAGDKAAIAALARHADRLARGLAVVINILDPDAIVLGGGLSNMSHLYTELPRPRPDLCVQRYHRDADFAQQARRLRPACAALPGSGHN